MNDHFKYSQEFWQENTSNQFQFKREFNQRFIKHFALVSIFVFTVLNLNLEGTLKKLRFPRLSL